MVYDQLSLYITTYLVNIFLIIETDEEHVL